jgi:hypothetical protein
MRQMIIKCTLRRHFNVGFDVVYDDAVAQCVAARGLDKNNLVNLLVLFKANAEVHKVREQ